MKRRQYLNIATGLCCLIWCVSLFVPAIDFNFKNYEPMFGWQILLMGWFAIIGFFQTGWLANIAFWGVLVGQKDRLILFTKFNLFILFLSTLHSLDLIIRAKAYNVVAVQIGYWLWIFSNFALCGVALIKLIEEYRPTEFNNPTDEVY